MSDHLDAMHTSRCSDLEKAEDCEIDAVKDECGSKAAAWFKTLTHKYSEPLKKERCSGVKMVMFWGIFAGCTVLACGLGVVCAVCRNRLRTKRAQTLSVRADTSGERYVPTLMTYTLIFAQ